MRRSILAVAIGTFIAALAPDPFAAAAAGPKPQLPDDPTEIQVITDFLGTGFGALDPQAPRETEAFGRLVGIWRAEQELRRQDGSWVVSAPAYWVWKYAPGGFAVQDLWYQSANALPVYLEHLGHDYLLTALRIYEASAGAWRVAWAANGGGKGPGDDFGIFEADETDGRIVMRSEVSSGDSMSQRIFFHSFEEDSFQWTSELSSDGGETWDAIMRVTARRVR